VDPATPRGNDTVDLLYELAALEFGPSPEGSLHESVARLLRTARDVAPSYLGMAITVVVDDQPVTLTVFEPDTATQITSLTLSLSWLPSLDPASRITFYAATAGAFTDLAADLAFVLGDATLSLDDDITNAPVQGLRGLPEVAAIDRAVGILVGHGHTVKTAKGELRRRAKGIVGMHQAALDIAADPTSPTLDR
jgi:hypothetical protein